MPFSKPLYAIAGVLLIHAVFIATSLYWRVPILDMPMHFAGGFVMGMLGIAIHHLESTRARTTQVSMWFHYLFVVGFTILIAVAWEFHEYILDRTLVVWLDWARTQPSLTDTMADLALGWLGGSVAFLIYRKKL